MATNPPAVQLSGLSKSYGPMHAVHDLDLSAPAGEIVAVLGPNGAGKSTLNELILGLVSPDAGRVAVFGADPRTAVQRGQVGAMLQGGALLYEVTVHDVLRLMHGLHPHPLVLPEIVDRADLGTFLTTKTDKLSGRGPRRLDRGDRAAGVPQRGDRMQRPLGRHGQARSGHPGGGLPDRHRPGLARLSRGYAGTVGTSGRISS